MVSRNHRQQSGITPIGDVPTEHLIDALNPPNPPNHPPLHEDQGVGDNDIPWILVNGEKRYLACLPKPEDTSLFCAFGDKNPLVPESEWRDVDYSWADKDNWEDQRNCSGCVGWSAVQLFRIAWALANPGLPIPKFSPAFVYGLINGGRDAGAMVYDSIKAMTEYGVSLKDHVPDGMIFRRNFPQAAFETAKRFRVSDGYLCRSLEEIDSALQLGFVVSIGVRINNSLHNLDSEGIAAKRGRGSIGGHAMSLVGYKKHPRRGRIRLMKNSWGRGWGMNGYAWLDDSWFDGENDFWAVQAVTIDPKEPNVPPVAVAV